MDNNVILADETGSVSAVGGGGGADGIGLDDEEDEDDEPSSSNLPNRDLLDDFRQQWKEELGLETRRRRKLSSRSDSSVDVEEEAKRLFQEGVQAEQNGRLYEAIAYYRQAVQLVPDIEFRCQDLVGAKPCSKDSVEFEKVTEREDTSWNEDDLDLVTRFQKLIVDDHSNRVICQAAWEQKATHISALPVEVLMYIFKWVVSSELDLRALEQLSLVSRGFYVCARDSELWRLACVRIFGQICGTLGKYSSWRDMWIKRPHMRYNGCYISKTTYVRRGEQSLDSFYRPWHVVEYYRYLRFFPDGSVLMLTTPEDPYCSLPRLKAKSSKVPSLLIGHYRMMANTVVISMRKRKSNEYMYSRFYGRYKRSRHQPLAEPEKTFHLELEVKSIGHRPHFKLEWHCYSIITRYHNGQDSHTDFHLTDADYPPFYFSRVKSYCAISEQPLQ